MLIMIRKVDEAEVVSATLGACQGKIYKPDSKLLDGILSKEL